MCLCNVQQLFGAVHAEDNALSDWRTSRRHRARQFSTEGTVLSGSTSEIGRIGSVGVALEPHDLHTVILEDPQRQEVRRPLDEHDVARHRPQREDEIQRAGAAGGDQHVAGIDRVVDLAVVFGDRFAHGDRAADAPYVSAFHPSAASTAAVASATTSLASSDGSG